MLYCRQEQGANQVNCFIIANQIYLTTAVYVDFINNIRNLMFKTQLHRFIDTVSRWFSCRRWNSCRQLFRWERCIEKVVAVKTLSFFIQPLQLCKRNPSTYELILIPPKFHGIHVYELNDGLWKRAMSNSSFIGTINMQSIFHNS